MRKRIDEEFSNLKNRDIYFMEKLVKNKFARTIICGVKLEDINRISKLIIESNPNVLIDCIGYVSTSKDLVFYATNKLDLSAYDNYKKQLVSKNGKNYFARYLYFAFQKCGEIKANEVSLHDIASIYEEKAKEFKHEIDSYKEIINALLQINGKYTFCNYVDFNYNSSILTLGIDRKHKYRFKINNGKVEHLDEDLYYLDEYILYIYKTYLDYQSYCRTDIREMVSSNTKFFVNFDMLGFKTYLKDSNEILFQIDYDAENNYYSYKMYQVNFGKNTFIDDNYIDFLNYIYVDIEALPIWLQQEILGIKKESLSEKKGFLASARKFIERIRKLF